MPNRIIRESSRTSPSLDALSDGAERLFWRLVTVADDHGRFDAHPRVVLAMTFPLRVGRLSVRQVERWLDELERADIIRRYAAGDRMVGAFCAWARHQRRPQSTSKFPDPPWGHGDPTVTPRYSSEKSTVPPRSLTRVVNREVVNRESRVGPQGTVEGPTPGVVAPPESVARGSTGYDINPTLLARWHVAYPGVNVPHELRAAWEWEQANPTRRKVRLQAFLVGWLKRAQDRAPAGTREPPRARDRPAVLQETGPPGPTIVELLARRREEEQRDAERGGNRQPASTDSPRRGPTGDADG